MSKRLTPHILPLALWTAICGAFFWTVLVGAEHLPESDLSGQFHSYGLFQVRELAAGRLPVWSPGSYGGVPFAADPQAAVFYPPRWVTAATCLRGSLTYHALEIEAIAHVWVAGALTYALVRALTGMGAAGLVSAVAFGLGGYLTSYPLLQLAVLETIAWLPLTLLCLREGVRSARPLRWMGGAGLVLGVAATAGHPQTLLHVGYLSLAYLVFLTARARWPWHEALRAAAAFGAVAAAASAASWLPALRYTAYTTRREVDYGFVSGGLPLLDYLQALLPGTLSQWSPQYGGIGALLLAGAAWLARRAQPSDRRAEIGFWAGSALAAGWLALGDAGVVFELAHRVLPGLSLFRHQERLLGLVSFSVSVLAGLGLAGWRGIGEDARPRLVRAGGYLAGALALGALALWLMGPSASAGWPGILGRQVLVGVLALGTLCLAARRSSLGRAVLVALLVADLYAATYPAINRRPGPPSRFWPEILALGEILPEGEPARVDLTTFLYGNPGETYGIEDISGISPLRPAALETLRQRLGRGRLWQLLNVAGAITPDDLSGVAVTALGEIPPGSYPNQIGPATVYRFERYVPRAHVVHRSICAADDEEALALLAAEAFDPLSEVVLHGACPPAPAAGARAPAQATVRRVNAGEILVETVGDWPGYLVLSEWHYPGWRALLDGEPVPLLRANYAFQAVALPAGHHTLRLTYTAPDVWAGLALSALGVLMAALLLRSRRPVPEAATAPARRLSLPPLGVPWPPPPTVSTAVRRVARAAIPAGILVVALGLRVVGAAGQELRGDEAYTYLMASAPAEGILGAQIGTGEPHSPLPYYLLHGWMRLAGRGELAMRFPSILAGVLAIALSYRLGRELWGRRVGASAALLMGVSQSLVWVSQDARTQYGLALVASLGAMLALLRALRRPSVGRWGAYSVLVALTAYSHLYGLFAVLAHGLGIVACAGWRRTWRAWALSVAAAAAAYAPWCLISLPHVLATGQLLEARRPHLAGYLVEVGTWVVSGSGLATGPARWLLLLGVAGVAWRLRRRGRDARRRVLEAWAAIATAAVYLVLLRRTMFNAFYLSLAAPAWWLLVGLAAAPEEGGGRQQDRVPGRASGSRAFGVALVLAFLAANALSLRAYYTDPRLSRTQGYREVAAYVGARAGPGDLFLANWPDPCWDYYLEGVPMPRRMVPTEPMLAEEAIAEAVARELAGAGRVWLAPYRHPQWDGEGTAWHWLEHNALLEHRATFGSLSVSAYRSAETATEVLLPVEAGLDGAFRAAGYHLLVDGEPAGGANLSLQPGARLEVTVAWESLAAVEQGYTVFVHLVSDDGRLLAQHDGVPVFGTRPTWVWRPGETILDRHSLTVPADAPPGGAALHLGIYDSETLERRPLGAAGETVVPARVAIE